MKNISLALWWWAARWYVHLGLIKYLEEKKYNITEVSWTSMWAIIGWLVAIWYSSEEMIEFWKKINFLKHIDFWSKEWLLKGKKVYKLLLDIFWETKIENLKIDLKIIACNIDTWEKKVFTSWKIIDAIRASISLPWIFNPFVIDEINYVDGWIISNLPIEVLTWDNIIASSALKTYSTPIKKSKKLLWMEFSKWFFNINFQILQRSTLILMQQNELRSIESNNAKVINYNFEKLDFFDFHKLDQFVEIGYKEAKKI